MNKLIIDRQKLFKFYLEKVNHLCDSCDWITSVSPELIIDIIAEAIEQNPSIVIEDTTMQIIEEGIENLKKEKVLKLINNQLN
jgi:hypothetical protein